MLVTAVCRVLRKVMLFIRSSLFLNLSFLAGFIRLKKKGGSGRQHLMVYSRNGPSFCVFLNHDVNLAVENRKYLWDSPVIIDSRSLKCVFMGKLFLVFIAK